MENPPLFAGPKLLIVTPDAKKFLNTAANWARFLGILAFSAVFIIALGTYFLALLSSGISKQAPDNVFEELFMMTTVFTVIFILMTIIYFYALYKILRFAGTIKKAIKYDDSETLTEAFRYLKDHYKSMGIMMLVGIVLYTVYSIVIGIIIAYGMAVFVNTF